MVTHSTIQACRQSGMVCNPSSCNIPSITSILRISPSMNSVQITKWLPNLYSTFVVVVVWPTLQCCAYLLSVATKGGDWCAWSATGDIACHCYLHGRARKRTANPRHLHTKMWWIYNREGKQTLQDVPNARYTTQSLKNMTHLCWLSSDSANTMVSSVNIESPQLPVS